MALSRLVRRHKNAREQNNKGGTALMTSLTLMVSVRDFLCEAAYLPNPLMSRKKKEDRE